MSNFIPKELKYTKSHEWVREESDGTVTIGITHHAQELLGDIVYVELPELQKNFKNEESIVVVESVKAAADVYAPVTGQIVAINNTLSDQPELVNVDPYGDGWLCQIKPLDKSELAKLLDAGAYQQSIEAE
ncbi:MAG TPA: glycine cleavage system protein GcvH [Gammaproteobacteria bacterium]|nr:glycine cleavage system protein GcvH [Gammaproteobacteria bacterium]